MKPTEGKCEDCKFITNKHPSGLLDFCVNLENQVKKWWTGCVMWEKKE